MAKQTTPSKPVLQRLAPKAETSSTKFQQDTIYRFDTELINATLGGYVRKVKTFKNESNRTSGIITFQLDEFKKGNGKTVLKPGLIKFWRNAALKDFISRIDIDGYVEMKYLGKTLDEDNNEVHSFDFQCEKPLS